MQAALRSTGLQGASRPQLSRSRRGCLAVRVCNKQDVITAKEHSAPQLAVVLASGALLVATAAPALADEALVAAIAPEATTAPTVAFTAEAIVVDTPVAIPTLAAPPLQQGTAMAAQPQQAKVEAAAAPLEAAAAAASGALAATEPTAADPAAAAASSASASASSRPTAELLTYAGLGTAALTFLATFFVAPRYREAFKESVDWRAMYAALVARGVRSVGPEEAYGRARKGAVLLDVRLASQAAACAPQPSTGAPLYRPIAGWDLASNIRRAGFAFFGIFGTELNPDFLSQVEAVVPRGREVLVLCDTGGSLDNKPGTQFGFQSRSLKAMYFLQQAGYTRVTHVKGGLRDWLRAGLPTSTSDPQEQQQSEQREPAAATGSSSRKTTSSSSSPSPSSTTTTSPPGAGRGSLKGTLSLRAAARELVGARSRK